MPMNSTSNQNNEWQVQVSKKKKNAQKKQKKGQKYSSKEQVLNKNKRDSAYYFQNPKKSKEQNGNKNKNGKRSNKYENKLKKQNKERDNILDSIPIERNNNLNIIKSTSLLKIQFERQQESQKDVSIDIKSKDLLHNPKKTMSEMSDITAVSVTSLSSESNSVTSSTLTQTNSLKDINDQHEGEVVNNSSLSKDKLSDSTLLNKEQECSSNEKSISSSSDKSATPVFSSESSKPSSSNSMNTIKTNGIVGQKEEFGKDDELQKDEIIKKLQSQCSVSSSSSAESFVSDDSSKCTPQASRINDNIELTKNKEDDLKVSEKRKETEKTPVKSEEKCDEIKKEDEKVDNKKEDMTKKVLEFNFRNYTDVQPFIPKHLKAKQEQPKVEIVAPKPQNARHNSHSKGIIEKKHSENDNTPKRKTKEINKIIRIDPSCLHQKDGHIVPIAGMINMKNGKNNSNNIQDILQRNIQQKTNELQESKKKKFEELRKTFDHTDKSSNSSKGYQSLPINENVNNKSSDNVSKKTEEKVVEKSNEKPNEKPVVRKTNNNPVMEVPLKVRKEHQRNSSGTMNRINMMQQKNLVEYKDDCLCHSISQLAVSSRIENEYNNVRCYNDPMEQSLTRVKPTSLTRSSSVQNFTTMLSKKGSNHQLLLGGNGCMTVTNTITTCKTTPRKLRSTKSFSWLKGLRNDLDNTQVTTISTKTTTSHSSTLYTNLVSSSVYYPVVVLPTASVQELSVETTTRRLKNSSSLPNMMGRLIRKITWPFSGNNIESETPVTVGSK